jgi:ABC-type multidrug transport system ATPase subunit
MSILCGALQKSSGEIYLGGHNVSNNPGAIHQFVGVCPQFDVVWNDLTVAEHLSFQARQRGIPSGRVAAVVQQAAIAVGLDGDSFDTRAAQLSGGMRRRLSIAMSIVGDPTIILMDGKSAVFIHIYIHTYCIMCNILYLNQI